ncbi:MAG: hypothetical protein IJI57_14105 [Flexilinea sp.]|nr:hypothetical protein [Flexilinea sp.]
MSQALLIPLMGTLLCAAGGLLLNIMTTVLVKLTGLLLFFLGGCVLLLSVCSPQMCAALLVSGVGVAVLLGTSQLENPREHQLPMPRVNIFFRIVLALISGILAYTVSDILHYWIPVRQTVLFAVLWNALMCLFSLSLDDVLIYRCMYLQSLCISFTITYIYMESSVLVFAFFAVINLLMAFGGSVLSLPKPEKRSEVSEDAA